MKLIIYITFKIEYNDINFKRNILIFDILLVYIIN